MAQIVVVPILCGRVSTRVNVLNTDRNYLTIGCHLCCSTQFFTGYKMACFSALCRTVQKFSTKEYYLKQGAKARQTSFTVRSSYHHTRYFTPDLAHPSYFILRVRV